MPDVSWRVQLTGDGKCRTHTIEIKPDGNLVAELYDFSDEAADALGGDIAWGISSLPAIADLTRNPTEDA